jgi:hypothetical protein
MASRFILPKADVGNGIAPSDGAQLFFTENVTDIPKDTFPTLADALADTNPNTNPVVSDADGQFANIFITGVYRVRLKDKNGSQVGFGVADNVSETVGVGDANNDARYGPIFATVAAMLAPNPVSVDGIVVTIVAGSRYATLGYLVAGDVGAGTYLGAAPQSTDGFGDHDAANGVALLLQGLTVDIAQYGVSTTITDNQKPFLAAINSGKTVTGSGGPFLCDGPILPLVGFTLDGDAEFENQSTAQNVLSVVGGEDSFISGVFIDGFKFTGGNGGAGTEIGNAIFLNFVDDFKILKTVTNKGNARNILATRCTNGLIENNTVLNAGLGYTTPSGGEAIMVNTCQFVKVVGNNVQNSGRHAYNMFRSLHSMCDGNSGEDIGHSLATISGNGDPASTKFTITNLTFAAGVATATSVANQMLDGGWVRVAGAVETQYNGTFKITRIDADTFTYAVAGSPATPATGTITGNDTSGQFSSITNNTGTTMARSGIVVENEAHGTVITGNTLEGMHDFGIIISAGHGDGPKDNIVSANSVLDVNSPVTGDGDGIRSSGAPRCTISGNTINDVERHGVRVNGVAAVGCIVSSNTINSADVNGVNLSAALGVAVVGNTMRNLGTNAIVLADGTTGSVIESNIISEAALLAPGAAHGIKIQDTSINNLINHNKMTSSGDMQDGINIEAASTGNSGVGNKVSGQSRNTVRYGDTANTFTGSEDVDTFVNTISGNVTFSVDTGRLHLIDGGVAGRNYNPSGLVGEGYTMTLVNTGTTNNLTFDSTGIAVVLTPGQFGSFSRSSGAWFQTS